MESVHELGINLLGYISDGISVQISLFNMCMIYVRQTVNYKNINLI